MRQFLTSFVVLVVLAGSVQAQGVATPQWYPLSNVLGYEGYGLKNAKGEIVVQRYRLAQAIVTTPAPVTAGDPYGFIDWLNTTRAQYGLPAVAHDQNLSNWASQNSAMQTSRGLGHYVMGPARRQNSAMGVYGTIGTMWMNSPAHRAALLDPTIRFVGLAGVGAYWTFNAF